MVSTRVGNSKAGDRGGPFDGSVVAGSPRYGADDALAW
jgi:hypothetical protein